MDKPLAENIINNMSEQQTPEMAPGAMAWNELITSNKGASIEFYSKLFGWTSEDMDMPNGDVYTMFKLDGKMVAGCCTPGEEAPEMWLSYVTVADIDASVVTAKELGAVICKERVDLPMGSFAVVRDPQGATFAFWEATGECPSQSQ